MGQPGSASRPCPHVGGSRALSGARVGSYQHARGLDDRFLVAGTVRGGFVRVRLTKSPTIRPLVVVRGRGSAARRVPRSSVGPALGRVRAADLIAPSAQPPRDVKGESVRTGRRPPPKAGS